MSTSDFFSGPRETVPVLLPVAISSPFTYLVPEGDAVPPPGKIVRVPLGSREVTGMVADPPGPAVKDPKKLKSILEIYPAPPINEELRRFIEWVARYTVSDPGIILRMVLRSPEALYPEPPVTGVRRAEAPLPKRLTPQRARIIDILSDGLAWSKSGLAGAAGVSPAVVDGLLKAGVLETAELPPFGVSVHPDPDRTAVSLNDMQHQAAETLKTAVLKGIFRTVLLDGVTGSGKTEVYFETIAEALRQDRQALVLLPEIALTGQLLNRFVERFGVPPAEWHSGIKKSARTRVWRGVADGSVKVVIGARSALFLPYKELGLIVCDEEHDGAYKQEDGAVYHARDMAIVRASIGTCPVVLASATPSVETHVNADLGRYQRIRLPARYAGQSLPEISTIDLRDTPPERGKWLSPPLVSAIIETLERKKQALLFLNRRGYAPLTLCRTCGHRFQCPNCTAWLVSHRFRKTLSCHHCGYQEKEPEQCPSCEKTDTLVACGPGVERVEEEVEALFPDVRTLVLSSDMMGGTERLRRELQAIADGEFQIIIGTQLVAKGHTFPELSLVGVVDGDLGLANADLRAGEKTFQLLSQVTGRAGRISGDGIGLIQTHAPEHPVMRALSANDPERYYSAEISERKKAGMPPFGRLAALILSGPDRAAVNSYGLHLMARAPKTPDVRLLGPADAAISVLRGQSRMRILAQAPKNFDLSGYVSCWLSEADRPKGSIRVQTDIDPVSFF